MTCEFSEQPTKDSKSKVVIVKAGVAKKTEKKNKGELLEQNVDALEVNAVSILKTHLSVGVINIYSIYSHSSTLRKTSKMILKESKRCSKTRPRKN